MITDPTIYFDCTEQFDIYCEHITDGSIGPCEYCDSIQYEEYLARDDEVSGPAGVPDYDTRPMEVADAEFEAWLEANPPFGHIPTVDVPGFHHVDTSRLVVGDKVRFDDPSQPMQGVVTEVYRGHVSGTDECIKLLLPNGRILNLVAAGFVKEEDDR